MAELYSVSIGELSPPHSAVLARDRIRLSTWGMSPPPLTTTKALALTQAQAVVLTKTATKPLALTQAQAATLLKTGTKVLALTQAQAVVVLKTATKALALVQAQAPLLTKALAKPLALVQAQAPALQKAIVKSFALGQAQALAVQKATTKALALAQAQAAVFAKTAAKTLALTQAQAAVLLKVVGKALAVTQAQVTATSRAVLKAIGRLIALIQSLQPRAVATTQQPQAVFVDGAYMLSAIFVRQNTVPSPNPSTIALQDQANAYAAIDLTGASGVTATMYAVPVFGTPHTGTKVFSARNCPIQSPTTGGTVTIAWTTADFATAGLFEIDWTITVGGNPTGTIQPLQVTVLSEA